jgi:hypothetical protein
VTQYDFNFDLSLKLNDGESQLSPSADLAPQIISATHRGWRLHPLRAKDKRPLLKNWPLVATSDLIQICTWAQKYPKCNWGCVCGPESGFFAVDVDLPEAMLHLEDEHGSLPDGLCIVTARGYALVYQWPVDADIRPHTDWPCAGIDIRGSGSYVVIPPSIHPCGHHYRYSDDSLPIPECPTWLLELILQRRSPSEAVDTKAAATLEAHTIGPGKRVPILASAAGKLISLGVPPRGIEAAITALNSTFSPPHSPEKVKSLVTDMVGRYQICTGALTSRTRKFHGY